MFSLLLKDLISDFYLSLTWSEIPKTDFLMTMLKLYSNINLRCQDGFNNGQCYMKLITRKPVFGVCDQGRL